MIAPHTVITVATAGASCGAAVRDTVAFFSAVTDRLLFAVLPWQVGMEVRYRAFNPPGRFADVHLRVERDTTIVLDGKRVNAWRVSYDAGAAPTELRIDRRGNRVIQSVSSLPNGGEVWRLPLGAAIPTVLPPGGGRGGGGIDALRACHKLLPSSNDGKRDMGSRLELLPGTLDLLVLRVLSGDEAHGYGIAQRVHRLSDGILSVGESSLYPALQRLLLDGLVTAHWGQSANNRRARFYRITARGRRQLAVEERDFTTTVRGIQLVMARA